MLGLVLHVVQFGGIYGGFALGVPAGLSALVMLGLSPLVTTGLAIAGGQERGDRRLWTGLAVGAQRRPRSQPLVRATSADDRHAERRYG